MSPVTVKKERQCEIVCFSYDMVSLPIGPHMTLSPIEGAMTRGVDPVLKVGGGDGGPIYI